MSMAELVEKDCDNIKYRHSVALTERLLDEIRRSIRVFKPSKSLSMLSKLAEDYEREHVAAEIDIVISGGGMKGYFMTGAYDILYQELSMLHSMFSCCALYASYIYA